MVATQLLHRIEDRFGQILRLPNCGASRPELAPGLRVVFCGRYAIYYLPRHDEIIIVRVLHGSRDLEAIVDESGFSL